MLLTDRPCTLAPEGATHPFPDIGATVIVCFGSVSGFALIAAGGALGSTTASVADTVLEGSDGGVCWSDDPLCIAVPIGCEGGLLGVLPPVFPLTASSTGRPSFPLSSSPPLPSLSRSTISLVLDAFSRFRFVAEAKKAGSNEGLGAPKGSNESRDSDGQYGLGESGGGDVVLDATLEAGVEVKIESGQELSDDGDSAVDPRDRPDTVPRPRSAGGEHGGVTGSQNPCASFLSPALFAGLPAEARREGLGLESEHVDRSSCSLPLPLLLNRFAPSADL